MNTKEKILRAGTELFSEKGFDTTTTRDICTKAECNIAAVNYHFKGKEGLGIAVIDYLFDDLGVGRNQLRLGRVIYYAVGHRFLLVE